MPTTFRKLAALVALTLMSSCGACDSWSNDGNTENGWFIYGPESPVAAGTTLPLVFLDAHTGYSLLTDTDIRNASSQATEHVSVVRSGGSEIVVRGESAGSAVIEFEGNASGDTQNDSFQVETVEPTGITLRTECSSDTAFRGEMAVVGFSFEPFSLGEGYYPVVVEPAGAATVNVEASNHRNIILDVAADAPDAFSVFVDPESGLTGAPVTLGVVDREARMVNVSSPGTIDTLSVDPLGNIQVFPTAGALSTTYCVAFPVTAQTSGSCGFIVDGAFTSSAEVLSSDLAIVALAAGTCFIDVVMAIGEEFVAANAELDLSAPPVPSSGGSSGSDFDFD